MSRVIEYTIYFNYSDNLGPEQLIPRLKAEPDTSEGFPAEYINELIARFNEDGLDLVNNKLNLNEFNLLNIPIDFWTCIDQYFC